MVADSSSSRRTDSPNCAAVGMDRREGRLAAAVDKQAAVADTDTDCYRPSLRIGWFWVVDRCVAQAVFGGLDSFGMRLNEVFRVEERRRVRTNRMGVADRMIEVHGDGDGFPHRDDGNDREKQDYCAELGYGNGAA